MGVSVYTVVTGYGNVGNIYTSLESCLIADLTSALRFWRWSILNGRTSDGWGGRCKLAIGNRIAVIGSGGAGKSTFSRRLGEISGLPVIHLDQLYWRSGWVQTPKEQWEAAQREMIEQDKWIDEYLRSL